LLKKAVLIAAAIALTGCANFIKAGSINEVYESFDEQKYEQTLVLIRRTENLSDFDPDLRAELTYMKAQTLAALGDSREANALYGYLKSQHSATQYAWLAELHLRGAVVAQ